MLVLQRKSSSRHISKHQAHALVAVLGRILWSNRIHLASTYSPLGPIHVVNSAVGLQCTGIDMYWDLHCWVWNRKSIVYFGKSLNRFCLLSSPRSTSSAAMANGQLICDCSCTLYFDKCHTTPCGEQFRYFVISLHALVTCQFTRWVTIVRSIHNHLHVGIIMTFLSSIKVGLNNCVWYR